MIADPHQDGRILITKSKVVPQVILAGNVHGSILTWPPHQLRLMGSRDCRFGHEKYMERHRNIAQTVANH